MNSVYRDTKAALHKRDEEGTVMPYSETRVGLVACSNPLRSNQKDQIDALCETLRRLGLIPVLSECIFAPEGEFRIAPARRARALMDFYADSGILAIFDLSGGDLANEILPLLDWELLRANPKPLWGYSDLTVLLDAVWQMTGQPSRLFQIRTLAGADAAGQTRRFSDFLSCRSKELFEIDWGFIQGTRMEGIVVGGNLRCLLKLAGTRYLPDFSGRLLFLEGLHTSAAQFTTYLSQLVQMGAFEKVTGLLLGAFTQLEETLSPSEVGRLAAEIIGRPDLPIAKTQQVGHGPDSRCLVIGEHYRLCSLS